MAAARKALAILLGASEWPQYPSFETSPAFQNSANFFRDYILREEGLGLPLDNFLYLFDVEDQPSIIVDRISAFLRKQATPEIRDIFFYYVGHGGYLEKEYFVALRCTNQANRDLTVLPVKYIAKKLYEETPDKRHIVIIDACYASGAVKDFIYQDAGTALADVRQQIREILAETDIEKGTALFCAAGPKSKAKAPWESEYTMFSGALQRVLSTGDPILAENLLSLKEVAELVEKDIFNTFRGEAVRPELHTPKQEAGDIRNLRLFPNPARRKELEGQSLRELRAAIDEIARTVRSLGEEFKQVRDNVVSERVQEDSVSTHPAAEQIQAGPVSIGIHDGSAMALDIRQKQDPLIRIMAHVGVLPVLDMIYALILFWFMSTGGSLIWGRATMEVMYIFIPLINIFVRLAIALIWSISNGIRAKTSETLLGSHLRSYWLTYVIFSTLVYGTMLFLEF